MDMNNPRHRSLFFSVHQNLPREAPGSDAVTLRALSMTNVPHGARVLDIGCGTGPHTHLLAKALPDARVTGLDAHPPYLEALRTRVENTPEAGRIDTVQGDMRALPFPDAHFDLLWCEAAVYLMGFELALDAWRRVLRPGGWLAVSDLVWLQDERPQHVVDYWTEYPDMTTLPRRLAQIADAGYHCAGHFVLPDSAWMDDYYTPMQARIESLKAAHAADPEAQAVLAECAEEIRVFRTSGGSYGYAFFIMQKVTI